MKKIMKVIPEKVTNKWFNSLKAKDRVALKKSQMIRHGILQGVELRKTPLQWWGGLTHVAKSDVYKIHKNTYESRGHKAPSNEKKVK